MQDWIPLVVLSVVALLVAVVAADRLPRSVGGLLIAGVLMRIAGSTARFEVLFRAYGGGDAVGYFGWGKRYAALIWDLDFRFLTTPLGRVEHWWGTEFVRIVSGFVVALTGPSMRAAFLGFSLFSFTGMVLIARAASIAAPRVARGYTQLLFFFPTLWFWPSSIGKEAVILLALGLFVRGFVGDGERPAWGTFASGLALAACVRPHVAALLAGSAALAELLRRSRGSARGKWTAWLGASTGAAVAVYVGLTGLGLGDADLEDIEEEIRLRAGQTETGGSQIERAAGLAALPMAFVNVLMRPFPGEGGALGLFSALEIWALWVLVVSRRRGVAAGLRGWRESRIFALAAPAAVSLTLLYGIGFANMGIIVRQRAAV
ncbi:MAG: hypothetical protein FJ104_06485, partial [Deltaproteobacteria bacterium]|nr:hypothetical protein [Deltaproteobacteria bacterium]